MIGMLGTQAPWSREALAFALDVALKATVLLLVAFALHVLLRRRRVLVCSVLWNTCLLGLVLLPAAAAALPRLRIDCLPSRPVAPVTALRSARSEFVVVPVANIQTEPPVEPSAIPEVSSVVNTASVAPLPTAVAPPQRMWDAIVIVAFVYSAVAALMALRLVHSLLAVRALRRASRAVEKPLWLESLERCRSRLGLRRPVSLRESERVTVPVVVGCIRPAIILPSSLAGANAARWIDSVLLHELAHVRRGDYAWNLLLRVVQIMYWPHPLAWPLGRTISSVREQACDDLCVHWMGDPSDYRATLLEVASGMVRRPGNALGVAMARTSRLGMRLARIESSRGSAHCLLGRPARGLIAATVIAGVGLLGSVQLARSVAAVAKAPDQPKAEGKGQDQSNDQTQPGEKKDEQTPKPEPKAESQPDATKQEPQKKAEDEKPQPQPKDIPRKVFTVKPQRGTFAYTTTQPGSVKASESISIYARIAGVVKSRTGQDRIKQTGQDQMKEAFYADPAVDALVKEKHRAEAQLTAARRVARKGSDPTLQAAERRVKQLDSELGKKWKELQPVLQPRAEELAPILQPGDQVKAGQVLAELSAPEIEADLRLKQVLLEQVLAQHKQAEAAVQVGKASIDSFEAKLLEAQGDVKNSEATIQQRTKEQARIKTMYQAGEANLLMVDEQEGKLQSAKSALAGAQAREASAKALVQQSRAERAGVEAGLIAANTRVAIAEAELQNVRDLAQFTKITSPIDGVVVTAHAQPGTYTRAGEGEPLFVVERTDPVTVSVHVPESDAMLVDRGDPAIVHVNALKNRAHEGKVARVSWGLDPKTRTLSVEIDLPNPDRKLRPGMSVNATIILEEHSDTLTIPVETVFRFVGGRGVDENYLPAAPSLGVFKVRKDPLSLFIVLNGRAVRKTVELGRVEGRRVEVLDSLRGNEELLVPPDIRFLELKDGQAVEASPLKEEQPKAPDR